MDILLATLDVLAEYLDQEIYEVVIGQFDYVYFLCFELNL